jgi:hypothetical protein
MKKLFLLSLLVISFSCKDEDNGTPTAPIVDTFDPMEVQATLLKEGTLTGVGHTVNGTVKVYDDAGKKVIVLDPFTSQNGPDLKIYLSTDQNATKYINLGVLKSTTGKQSYDITGTPNLAEYKFVLVWCQQFSILFGKAELN